MHPFRTLGQALAYINYNNPARQRFYNPLEKDEIFGSQNTSHGYDPADLFAATLLGIESALKECRSIDVEVWTLYNRGEVRIGVDEISNQLRVGARTVYRALKSVNNKIQAELVFRGIIPHQEH